MNSLVLPLSSPSLFYSIGNWTQGFHMLSKCSIMSHIFFCFSVIGTEPRPWQCEASVLLLHDSQLSFAFSRNLNSLCIQDQLWTCNLLAPDSQLAWIIGFTHYAWHMPLLFHLRLNELYRWELKAQSSCISLLSHWNYRSVSLSL